MTILHSGTTKKYSENWDSVFSGKHKKSAQAKPQQAAKKKTTSAKKRPAKKNRK